MLLFGSCFEVQSNVTDSTFLLYDQSPVTVTCMQCCENKGAVLLTHTWPLCTPLSVPQPHPRCTMQSYKLSALSIKYIMPDLAAEYTAFSLT